MNDPGGTKKRVPSTAGSYDWCSPTPPGAVNLPESLDTCVLLERRVCDGLTVFAFSQAVIAKAMPSTRAENVR